VIDALDGLHLAMISHGGSRKNLTVVVPESEAAPAMQRLHRRFFEPEDSQAAGEATVAG
jgi:aspartokinase